MADIFISYSSKDKEKADQLSELLATAGLSVWIDRQGIVGAEQWATEIVEGIRGCSTFIILLSPNSIESENVLRELSLASEKRKRVLPVDLEPILLPSSFEYPLAGLQRVAITEFDKILHSHKHGVEKVIKKDERKSLMILPFEDLSPAGDNGWFADGIVSELISALSNVKSIRIADNQATKEFKKYNGQLTTYAREMDFRYFVQGDVRKFGDNIKISARLLDIETGDNLWQESMKGMMENIFDFQEEVAVKVVNGLNIILTKDEKSKLDEWGTENAEAYEYYMRAVELQGFNSREGFLQAISLFDLSLKLDPFFVNGMIEKASALERYFQFYERDSTLLREAELLLQKVEELAPGGWRVHDLLALVHLLEGRLGDAGREHQMHIAKNDGSSHCLSQLGYFCFATKQYSKAFEYYETSLKLNSNDIVHLWNVIINGRKSGNSEGLKRWSEFAISAFQKQLRLHPEDAFGRYRLAATYFWSNPHRITESLNEINILESSASLDSSIQYQVAVLLAQQGDYDHALKSLRNAFNKGYADVSTVRQPDSSFAPLHDTPEFESVMKDAEELIEK